MTKDILWTKPTASGLGDRLNDVLKIMAYARVLRKKVFTSWPIYEIKSIDAPHRFADIKLENVRKYINFPHDIVFVDAANLDPSNYEPFNLYLGGTPFASEGWNQIAGTPVLKTKLTNVTFEMYNDAFSSVSKDFSFCAEITDFIDKIIVPFVSIHIRRSDKVRPVAVDTTMISSDEISNLDAITFKAIDYYIKNGYTNFFVCGDEDNKTQVFINYLQSKNINIIKVPSHIEKWRATYYDLAILTKSDHIAISNRNSAFSWFASLIGKGSCQTVYRMEGGGDQGEGFYGERTKETPFGLKDKV